MKKNNLRNITFTRTHAHTPLGRIKLTGLTLSHQYARLMDHFHSDWKLAEKVQNAFNRQFPKAKREKFWNPGHVIN